MEKLKFRTFKVEHENQIEYVEVLDKVRFNGDDKYLVVVVGEPASCYKNNKRYKKDYRTSPSKEIEIITPNMGMTFLTCPALIKEMTNR